MRSARPEAAGLLAVARKPAGRGLLCSVGIGLPVLCESAAGGRRPANRRGRSWRRDDIPDCNVNGELFSYDCEHAMLMGKLSVLSHPFSPCSKFTLCVQCPGAHSCCCASVAHMWAAGTRLQQERLPF